MKKVTVIVTHDWHKLLSLSVINAKGDLCRIFEVDKDTNFESFDEMQDYIVALLRQNNMRVPYYKSFGVKWYAITFIDLRAPVCHTRYSYRDNYTTIKAGYDV